MRWLVVMLGCLSMSACALVDGLGFGPYNACADAEDLGLVDNGVPVSRQIDACGSDQQLDLPPCGVGGGGKVFRFLPNDPGMYQLCVSGPADNAWVLAAENRGCDVDKPADGVCVKTQTPCKTFHISRREDSYLYVHAQPATCSGIAVSITRI